MKRIFLLFLFTLWVFTLNSKAFASYDPLTIPNNKFGIHILFPDELVKASELVNSGGGDWGYVLIPIQVSDKDVVKWQKFMNDCNKYHLIPILRLATTGDYFIKGSWSVPTDYDILDFANFLNSLKWPTQNRYIIIFNETNRADEWGGSPDPAGYAQILDYSTKVFRDRSPDFFIMSAGLDNASNNTKNVSIDDYTYMRQMEEAVPGIFSKIDGLSSHSYPNPGFSMPPSSSGEGVNSFYHQANLAFSLSGKNLPVFITETGWTNEKISQETQVNYYKSTFENYWNDPSIIAVTPFILEAGPGPFAQFSFISNGNETSIYKAYKNFNKTKGNPKLSNMEIPVESDSVNKIPTEKFKLNNAIASIYLKVNKSAKDFLKWVFKP